MHTAVGYMVGAGSMTLGVEKAGFDIQPTIEELAFIKNAQTWDLNRPHQPVRPILDSNDGAQILGEYRGLDLIFGNPPCGGLSAMSCSRITSPTNQHMRRWIRNVVGARPRMILMENAFQLLTPRIKPLLDDVTGVMTEAGYHWWGWRIYSYQVGTPQIRQRCFVCGSLDYPRRPELADLSDLPDRRDKSLSILPFVEDLIGVAPSPDPVLTTEGRLVTQHWYDKYAVHNNPLIYQHYERVRDNYLAPDDLRYYKDKPIPEGKLWEDCPPEFQGMQMMRPSVVAPDRPMGAIAGCFKFVSPWERRLLTMRELARCGGYPDDWQFHLYGVHLIAQGIPVMNAKWAAERMRRMVDGE